MSSSNSGSATGLRGFVGEQQVPATIVFFAVFAIVIYRFRHALPLASQVGLGYRRDVPASARARYEDSRALIDEARRILRVHEREVARELTASERDATLGALRNLEKAITRKRFDVEAFDAAHVRADRLVGEHLYRWRKGELREYTESILIAIAVALLLRAFVVEAFKIPSGSMIPTLMIGDHIFVNKLAYGPLVPMTDTRVYTRLPPARGDVMVFKFPENKEHDFIKRAIAVPGDVLEAVSGRPVINGWLVPNCYVGPYRSEQRNADLFIEYLEDKAYFTLYEDKPDDTACTSDDQCAAGLGCKGGVCGLVQGPFHVGDEEVWVMGDNRNNSHDSRSWNRNKGGGVPFENIKGRATFVWMSFGPGGGIASDRLFVNVMGEPTLPAGNASLQAAVDKCLASRPPREKTTPPPAK